MAPAVVRSRLSVAINGNSSTRDMGLERRRRNIAIGELADIKLSWLGASNADMKIGESCEFRAFHKGS